MYNFIAGQGAVKRVFLYILIILVALWVITNYLVLPSITGRYDLALNDFDEFMRFVERNPSKVDMRITEDGKTALFFAARHGNAAVATRLLELGADPEVRSFAGRLSIHYAAQYDHVEVAKLLMQYGASVDPKDNDGLTPLHMAASNRAVNMIEVLLERGANPNSVNSYGTTPLYGVAGHGVIDEDKAIAAAKLLLLYGADVNGESSDTKPDERDSVPLAHAALFGYVEIFKYLLSMGANVHQGNTLEMVVNSSRSDELLPLIINDNMDVNGLQRDGGTHLESAIMGCCRGMASPNCTDTVSILLGAGADPNTSGTSISPIWLAVSEGCNLDIIALLLNAGANINIASSSRETLLERAVDECCRSNHVACLRNVSTLIDRGADPNIAGNTISPLWRTIIPNPCKLELISLLVNKGADVNIRDQNELRNPPLLLATIYMHSYTWVTQEQLVEIIKILLEHGADPSAVDVNGKSPIGYATSKGLTEIASILLEYGAVLSKETVSKADKSPEMQYLIQTYTSQYQ